MTNMLVLVFWIAMLLRIGENVERVIAKEPLR